MCIKDTLRYMKQRDGNALLGCQGVVAFGRLSSLELLWYALSSLSRSSIALVTGQPLWTKQVLVITLSVLSAAVALLVTWPFLNFLPQRRRLYWWLFSQIYRFFALRRCCEWASSFGLLPSVREGIFYVPSDWSINKLSASPLTSSAFTSLNHAPTSKSPKITYSSSTPLRFGGCFLPLAIAGR